MPMVLRDAQALPRLSAVDYHRRIDYVGDYYGQR